jgi:hypothetical protein
MLEIGLGMEHGAALGNVVEVLAEFGCVHRKSSR